MVDNKVYELDLIGGKHFARDKTRKRVFAACRSNPTSERTNRPSPWLSAFALDGVPGRFALRDRAFWTFLCRTGYRVSEALSLQIRDVLDENGTAKDEVIVRKESMKGCAKSRRMPLHREVKEALAAYVRSEKLDHPAHRNTALFHRQGSPKTITRQSAWGILQTAAKRAGVSTERLGCHSARKTFASKMYPKVGGDVLKMAQLLNHENPRNTALYVQFLSSELTDAVLCD